MPLGRYIREQLLGDDAAPRKKRGRYPVKDHEALRRVFGALGSSRLSSNLNQLARASDAGSLPVTPETEAEIKEAFEAVIAMRKQLMLALASHRNPPRPLPDPVPLDLRPGGNGHLLVVSLEARLLEFRMGSGTARSRK